MDRMLMDQPESQPYGFFWIDDLTYEPAGVANQVQTLSQVKALF